MLALSMVASTMRRKHNLAPHAWGGLTDVQQHCYGVLPHFSSSLSIVLVTRIILYTNQRFTKITLYKDYTIHKPKVY